MGPTPAPRLFDYYLPLTATRVLLSLADYFVLVSRASTTSSSVELCFNISRPRSLEPTGIFLVSHEQFRGRPCVQLLFYEFLFLIYVL